jgi:serine/threonine protein phosphatase PrpC
VTNMAYDTALRWAGATDVGQVRSNNQDRYLGRPQAGLWAVADGMGGHQGGEIASQLACEALAERFGEHTIVGLVDAIEAANSAVHQAGNEDPELAGMGTTVVAIALVRDNDDEVLAVANVGDSRAYRLADGVLEQLTEDHSLVADMVREGSLSAEEAATHPQRNILTRVLGVYDEVPVDVITVSPHHGDRYLLCSDGLFNEVPEEAIASVLRRLVDPAEAADELVQRAVQSGGRDNVTVLVVDVVDDGGRSERASAAIADTASGLDSHERTRDLTGEHTGEQLAPYSGGAYALTDVDEEEAAPAHRMGGRSGRRGRRGRRDDSPRHQSKRPRRFTWRVALFTLLVLGVLGGAFALIQWYGRAAYYVGFDGEDVAIFRGRPGGVLWIDPEQVETTSLQRDDVPQDTLDILEAGKEQASLEEAQTYVSRLEDRVAEQRDAGDPDATGGSTTTLPTTTTTRDTTTSSTAAP